MVSQLGPLGDLDPPALVVREVQVKAVDLVERQQVDVALHLGRAEEVPGDVEHRAPPAEARRIGDASGGNGHRERPHAAQLDGPRQQLAQRLEAVEDARGVFGSYADALPPDREVVPFLGTRAGGLHLQANGTRCRCRGGVADLEPGFERGREQVGQIACDAPELGLLRRHLDHGILRDRERVARRHGHRRGPRDERRPFGGRSSRPALRLRQRRRAQAEGRAEEGDHQDAEGLAPRADGEGSQDRCHDTLR